MSEKLSDLNLKPLRDNPMTHGKRNKKMLTDSLEEFGFSRSVVAHKGDDGELTILAGHGTLEACAELGLSNVVMVPADGKTIIVTVREGLTKEEQYRLALMDNASARQAFFDKDALEAIHGKHGVSMEGIFTEAEFAALTKSTKDKQIKPEETPDEGAFETGYFVLVECEDREEQLGLFENLVNDGFNAVKYEGKKKGSNDT